MRVIYVRTVRRRIHGIPKEVSYKLKKMQINDKNTHCKVPLKLTHSV